MIMQTREQFARHIEAQTGFDVQIVADNTDVFCAMQYNGQHATKGFEFGISVYRRQTDDVEHWAAVAKSNVGRDPDVGSAELLDVSVHRSEHLDAGGRPRV